MSFFLTRLKITPIGAGHTWVLLEDLVYQPNGHEIRVPAGFRTDFASVPRVFWPFISPHGKHGRPAVVHDRNYWFQDMTRYEADRHFLIGMRDRGVWLSMRYLMYWTVRLFGWAAWRANRRARLAGIDRVMSLDELPDETQPEPPRGLDRLWRGIFARRAA